MSSLNLIPEFPPTQADLVAVEKLIAASTRQTLARMDESTAVAKEAARRAKLPPARQEELAHRDDSIAASKAEQEYWRAVHTKGGGASTPAGAARNAREDREEAQPGIGKPGHRSEVEDDGPRLSHGRQCALAQLTHFSEEIPRMDDADLKAICERHRDEILEHCRKKYPDLDVSAHEASE